MGAWVPLVFLLFAGPALALAVLAVAARRAARRRGETTSRSLVWHWRDETLLGMRARDLRNWVLLAWVVAFLLAILWVATQAV